MLLIIFLLFSCKSDTSQVPAVKHYVYESTMCNGTFYTVVQQDDLQLDDNGTFILQHLYHETLYYSKPQVTKTYGSYRSYNDTLELKSAVEGENKIWKYRWINNNTSLEPMGNTSGHTLTRMIAWTNRWLPEKKIKIDTYYQGHL